MERQKHDVCGQHVGLHDGPVGHPAVTGAAVEVEVAVQIVVRPDDGPDQLAVLAGPRLGHEGRQTAGPAQVVHRHVAVSQAGRHHLGVGGVTGQAHHAAVGLEDVLRV